MRDRILFWRRKRVPVIELHGILASRVGALNIRAVAPAVDRAFRALRGKGGDVVLDIDSPGGSPVQSDLIATLIRRRAAEKGTRVHAVIQEVGASGGYWLACAADEIHANPMSIVGSIGVVMGTFGVHDLLERHGVQRRLYTSGRNKARLDPFSPERPEDVAYARGVMDDIHARFKEWVRERRGPRLAVDDETLFDGSFFLADRARALGLIDGFTDTETLVKRLGGEKAVPRRFAPKRRRGLLSRIPRLFADAAIEALEERAMRPDLRA